MRAQKHSDYQSSYDRVAGEYARHIFDELQHKPLDRELLDRFAASVRDIGLVCDMGCGPGHVARYLHEARSFGMRRGPFGGDGGANAPVKSGRGVPTGRHDGVGRARRPMGGHCGLFIIHIPRSDLALALRELRRTLLPGGLLLLAFHVGSDAIHLDEWWGHKVCVDFFFFRRDEMEGYLRLIGFEVEEAIERDPYPEVEHQSRRAYIFARKLMDDT